MKKFNHGKYADVKIDFAFKRCFGTVKHKAATIGMLNALIPNVHIIDVEFINTEIQGLAEDDRKGIIDVLCKDQDESTFIVEMQRAPQPHFRERMVYYSSLYLLNQSIKGDWDFSLRKVYVIAFLNFSMKEMGVQGNSLSKHYTCRDLDDNDQMPGSAEFLFYDLKDFTKKESELNDESEYWLYLLRNSQNLTSFPYEMKTLGFEEFMRAAEIANYSESERLKYEHEMTTAQDIRNAIAFAEEKGSKETMIKIAANLKSMGMPVDDITRATGLDKKDVLNL